MRRSNRRATPCRCPKSRCEATRCRPAFEPLEPRNLLTAVPTSTGEPLFSGQASVCNCPVCTGVGLDDLTQEIFQSETIAGSGGLAADLPQGTLPLMSSRPGATAKLFLDFDGHFQAAWVSKTNVTTRVFDTDGNAGSFSAGEQNAIYQIWQRVAEDYAPFNIDVTTIDPGSLANRVVAHIAIGGNWSDWYGSSAGGVAYVGGFYNSAPNVGYVFEDALGNGNAKYVAEAASHEAGHLFGLQHQAKWNGSTLAEPYHKGIGDWAPIMGVGYYVPRSTWHNGATSASPTAYQDDLAILSGSSNGFGYVADDYGSTIATASTPPVSGTSVSLTGLIGRANDLDVFAFATGGGNVSFNLAVHPYGPNLDAVLELWNSAGNVLTTVAPSGSFGASLSYAVGAGTFYLVARGMGDYGDMGQYTITGTVPAAAGPEIAVQLGATTVTDGQSVHFGSVQVGASVNRTFTIVNQGTSTLSLESLLAASLPPGFLIVSNVGSTTLAPDASTTFTLRFEPGAAGSFSGGLSLTSNDDDESPFELVLQGTGEAPAPEISVFLGTTDLASGSAVDFGSTSVGTSVTRTITIRNDGDAPLNLTLLDPADLPAGYSIVSNLESTVLAVGQSTTLVLQLDASFTGSCGGSLILVNDDGDENSFSIGLAGIVNAFVPTKQIKDDGDAGYAVTGAWTRTTGNGYEGDSEYSVKGAGAKFVTWTFTGLPTGEYNIWGTWTAAKGNASNAPFTFTNGTGEVITVRKDQRVAPTTSADGYQWAFLKKVAVVDGWVRIKLANNADAKVVADAIRIVQVVPAAAKGAASLGPEAAFGAFDSLYVLASAGNAHDNLHALALPHTPAPALSPTLSGLRSSQTALQQIWSQADDVRPERELLEDVVDLLTSLRESSQDGESLFSLDQFLADAGLKD